MLIRGDENTIALFGHPVSHSLSPAMHNAAFKEMGLWYRYEAFDVAPDDLRDALYTASASKFAGFNLTVPHKQAVMPMLNSVDPEASFIGAVNTVVNEYGRLVGHNTDGRGFMRSLEEEGIEVAGKKVILVGAGGAARAVSWYLAEAGADLCIYNRSPKRASELVFDLVINFANVSHIADLAALEEADVVVNCTSLGLNPADPLPFDLATLKSEAAVVDLIYTPTPLQEAARKKGHQVVNGLGMLLWQGVLASELWTRQEPPVQVMREALLQAIS